MKLVDERKALAEICKLLSITFVGLNRIANTLE